MGDQGHSSGVREPGRVSESAIAIPGKKYHFLSLSGRQTTACSTTPASRAGSPPSTLPPAETTTSKIRGKTAIPRARNPYQYQSLIHCRYSACIRQECGFCCVQYTPCADVPADESFSIDTNLATAIAQADSVCSLDYIGIPGLGKSLKSSF